MAACWVVCWVLAGCWADVVGAGGFDVVAAGGVEVGVFCCCVEVGVEAPPSPPPSEVASVGSS